MVSQHKELKLIRGVPIIPTLTTTLEPGTDLIINLLSGEAEGFALNPSPGSWEPGLPAPKAGLWQETPFLDGRIPIADAYQNVTETMQVVLSAPNYLLLSRWMSKLALLSQDIAQFWNQEAIQMSPVYIHWWATDAPGPQYALIMSLDFAVTTPGVTDTGSIVRDVTLTIEREPYWRGVPPGASPMLWTLYTLGRQPGKDFDSSNMPGLNDDNKSLHESAFINGDMYATQSTTSVILNSTTSTNQVTIPASKIPGDVPPLITLFVKGTRSGGDTDTWSWMIANRSGQTLYTSRIGFKYRFMSSFPALAARSPGITPATDNGDALFGYDVDTGVFTATQKRLEYTPGVTYVAPIDWLRSLNINLQRGRYAVFLRCRQSAGSAGDITVYLGYGISTTSLVQTDPVAVPLLAGAGDTTHFPYLYMGTIKLPPENDILVSVNDLGLSDEAAASEGFLGDMALFAKRSAGVGVLFIRDLLLMPLDEGFISVKGSLAASTDPQPNSIIVDNTGYISHGKPGMVARIDKPGTLIAGNLPVLAPVELSGSELVLQPKTDNTLCFAIYNQDFYNAIPTAMKVYVNIVPRWMGVRDA